MPPIIPPLTHYTLVSPHAMPYTASTLQLLSDSKGQTMTYDDFRQLMVFAIGLTIGIGAAALLLMLVYDWYTKPEPAPEPKELHPETQDDTRHRVVMQGRPVHPTLEAVFGAWGKPKSISASIDGIVVMFEGNYVLTFIPTKEQVA